VAVYKTSNSGLLTRREYTSFLAGNSQFIPWEPSSAYDSIATTTLSTATASVTFNSIPATYTHLQIRATARGTSTVDSFVLRFNNDTSISNYNSHYLYGSGSAASGATQGVTSYMFVGSMPTSSSTANSFGATVIDILDYTSVNKTKVTRSLTGQDNSGSGGMVVFGGIWFNSSLSAVTRIDIFPNASTGNFAQYSSFALYGIKGA
jgi:hypothetical protein